MAMTAEQNASIKDMWGKIQGDPSAVFNAMDKYGIDAQALATATGQSMGQVGSYLTNNGAADGFGGYQQSHPYSQSNPSANSNYNNIADMPVNNYAQYQQKMSAASNDPTANLLYGGGSVSESDWNAQNARAQADKARGVTFGGGSSGGNGGSNLGMGGGSSGAGGYGPGGQFQNSSNSYGSVGGINPYLDQMAGSITNQMNDNWNRNLAPSIRSGAMAAGGFGGSRQGVVEANGLNDMNRSLGQNLSNMYGQAWQSGQQNSLQQQSINNGLNLGQQGLNNSYDLGMQGLSNNYDLGMRGNLLGQQSLDANINNSNFSNQLASANFGMNAYQTMMNQTQSGINAGTNMQNTPLDYQKYFSNSANGVGQGYGTSSGTNSGGTSGNPYTGMMGGAMMGSKLYDYYNQPNTMQFDNSVQGVNSRGNF